MSVRVIKIGGAALDESVWLDVFASAVARAREPLVIVHGGGPEISALSERLQIPVQWHEGRRVTPPAALEVASMVLSGRLNKRVVTALLNAGADSIGVSGEDGGLVVGRLIENGLLGRVGAVTRVRSELLEWLLARGMVPVVSPVSRGEDGAPLNINADEVATAVACALGASELLFITDVAGVCDAAGLCAELSADQAAQLVSSGVARDGMALKVGTALDALYAGVAGVRIGRPEIVLDPAAGTKIFREAEVMACR